MKKTVLIFLLFSGLAGLTFGESKHNIGAGVILGEPTGLTMKFWNKQTVAVDVGAAWSFVNGGFLQVHSDLLFHNFNLFRVETGRMALYYGIGGRVKFADDLTVSVRVPIGLSYEFEKTPVELFLEIVPMLDVVPATEVNMAGGIGFRYYF